MKFKKLNVSILLILAFLSLIRFTSLAQPPSGYYDDAEGLKGQALQASM